MRCKESYKGEAISGCCLRLSMYYTNQFSLCLCLLSATVYDAKSPGQGMTMRVPVDLISARFQSRLVEYKADILQTCDQAIVNGL